MKSFRKPWWLIFPFLFFLGFVPSYRGDLGRILEKLQTVPVGEPKMLSLEINGLYLECQHSETQYQEITGSALPDLLREDNKNLVLSGYTGEKLVLTEEITGLCPLCREEEFIGIYEDHIAVYAGLPHRPGPVKNVTAIKIRGLPEQEVRDLSAGIIFQDEKEKLLILEAYSEEQRANNKPEE